MAKARLHSGDDDWAAAATGTPTAPVAPAKPKTASKRASKQESIHANKPAPQVDESPKGKQVPDGLVPFSTYLPPDLRRRVKVRAAEDGVSVWEVVRDALEAYLTRN